MKSIPGHMVSLGIWVPPIVPMGSLYQRVDEYDIRCALDRMWHSRWDHLQCSSIDIRHPGYFSSNNPPKDTVFRWHYDCRKHTSWMILWATADPTHLRIGRSRKIRIPDCFEVVLINNKTCQHRTPPTAYQKDSPPRWFARVHSDDSKLQSIITMKGD